MVIDLTGFIRYANEFCERERGYAPGALVGKGLADLERTCTATYENPQAQIPRPRSRRACARW
jgi:PAS domain-containing protein